MTRVRRRGTSIIEVLVYITIAAIVMSSMALCFDSLFRIQRQATDAVARNQVMARLAGQLRNDVNRARSMRLVDPSENANDTARLELTMEDSETIDYAFDGESIARTAVQGAEVARRESYWLGSRTEVEWMIDRDVKPAVASCVLLYANAAGESPTPRVQLTMSQGVERFDLDIATEGESNK